MGLSPSLGKREIVRLLLLVLSILVAYWIFCALLYSQESNIPPDVLMISNLNCRIEKHGKRWFGKGVVSYLQHENYSREPWETAPFPDRKSNAASLKDCNRWFDEVHKIQAVTKPVDVNDLKKREKQ